MYNFVACVCLFPSIWLGLAWPPSFSEDLVLLPLLILLPRLFWLIYGSCHVFFAVDCVL